LLAVSLSNRQPSTRPERRDGMTALSVRALGDREQAAFTQLAQIKDAQK
jgi:hypothetical protein